MQRASLDLWAVITADPWGHVGHGHFSAAQYCQWNFWNWKITIQFLLDSTDSPDSMPVTHAIAVNSKMGLLVWGDVSCHCGICHEIVRWHWKPKKNGVQNPKYYPKSTIYFNNYELHVRTITPNNVKKTLWQTDPLPVLKSRWQCQPVSDGYLPRLLSTFSWCSSDAVGSWKLYSVCLQNSCAPTFHWAQRLGCQQSWPPTTKPCRMVWTDPKQKLVISKQPCLTIERCGNK